MAVLLSQTLERVLAREEQWHQNPGSVWGLDTGFEAINQLTGGIHPGLTFLGARTSHGKTALAMQIALFVAQRLMDEWDGEGDPPGRVLIFSPEMTAEDLMERYAAQMSGVPVRRIKTGVASEEERQAWREW